MECIGSSLQPVDFAEIGAKQCFECETFFILFCFFGTIACSQTIGANEEIS